VTAEELEGLTTRFGRLIGFNSTWAEFLAARRPGDEVWRFVSTDGREGFAVVRQGRPLAEFLVPDPDLERQMLEHAARQA
jgi:hypothetical protein